MAQPNIIQFLEMLDDIPYDEEDIYRIWDKIPEEIKQNNIKCGVCAPDFYTRK
jgi:protein-tyrosine phosphatase